MSINAWASDQGALFAVPMTSAMPPDPSNGSWLLQWDPILRQLKYAPFVPPAPEFDFPVPYVGGLAMTVQNQTVEYAGTVYAPVLGTLPFITSGIWATDSAKFRVIQGVTLAEVQTLLVPKANLESPALTGTPTTPTQATTDNSTQVVNSSWVRSAMANIATAAGFALTDTGTELNVRFPTWLGGLVIKSGFTSGTTDAHGGVTATFGSAFPTAVRGCLVSNGYSSTYSHPILNTLLSSGVYAQFTTGTAAISSGIPVQLNYIAIGY